MVYRPIPVYQLDGSRFQGFNCVAATDAMDIDRSTAGAIKTTGAHVRQLTGDTSGGLLLDQVRYVNRALYSLTCEQDNKLAWSTFESKIVNTGAIALIRYNVLRGGPHDCFKGNFTGNHALYVNERLPSGNWLVLDPGADGRYAGCPHGWQEFTDDLLQRACGAFIPVNAPLGKGFVQVLFSQPDRAVKHYTVSFRPLASIRSYRLGTSGCIASWKDSRWYNKSSSAPGTAPVHRPTCDGKSGATTTQITAGVYKGQTLRVGVGGVTIREV